MAKPPLVGPVSHRIDRRTVLRAVGGALLAAPLASACATGSDAPTVRISYQRFGSSRTMETYLQRVATAYTARHPGTSIELVPLVAAENDYFTKNELMMSSPRTTADIVYEDTFILRSDVAAGYLRPIDDYVEAWPLWDQYFDVAKEAVQGEDGRTYAVPGPTDTRALYYHRGVFADAGLPTEWAPRTWDDILAALRQVHERLPDVVPSVIFAGKPQGEKASMQGVQMLLAGTGSVLYDETSRTWTTGSAGLVESMEFLRTVYGEGLGPAIGDALDPNLTETIYTSWLPQGRLAVLLDGNWITQNWVSGGPGEWPGWSDVLGLAPMPTRDGAAPGSVSLAGGLSWALPALARDSDRAWSVLAEMMDTENAAFWTISDTKLSNRRDITSRPDYLDYSPVTRFFTDLVPTAGYRPALAPYPEISSALQAASEVVITGSRTPEAAVAEYDRVLTDIVGADAVAPEARA